jgi:hypothetical protein
MINANAVLWQDLMFVLTPALTQTLPMNPKMVGRTPHPGPLPIGFADAERGRRSLRLDDGLR